jgi:hypothetical protein
MKLMSRFLKFVLWLAIAAAFVYGGYYTYENWWNEDAAKTVSEQASVLGETAAKRVGEYAQSVASTTKAAAGSFLKNKVGEWVSVVGEQLLSMGANLSGVTSSPSAAFPAPAILPVLPAGNVSAPTGSLFSVPPPPATIVVSVNERLSFSVNSGNVYKIDWGDGEKDQGATTAGNITIIHHGWTSPGDYSVNVSIGNSVSSNVYSFPVRVYE